MLIIRYIEKGVTQTTQIKQIFTDNFVHHEFLICGHLFNLCHLCAIKIILLNCDLSPLSATNSAKQLERSKKMENAEQEFVSVVREYERVIYKVCYLYTTPNATLNDLYQEVVLNLWKAFPKFRRECKISTWIYRIALNTCISFIRKEKNIPEIVTLNQEADRTEETDETQAMLRQLYRMINRLGQLEKSIILLYLEEKSYEEIAEITGLTLTNVATKLSRIKDKLKRMNKEE